MIEEVDFSVRVYLKLNILVAIVTRRCIEYWIFRGVKKLVEIILGEEAL
jgi:hypothetical protein